MNLSGNGTITIQAGNAAIEFNRGDLALDFAVIPGSSNMQPQLQVSTLSGTAQVILSVATPGAPRMPLYQHETVILDVTTRNAVINRQPLNQEIAAYWSRNGFRQAGMSPHSTYLAQGGGQSALPVLGAYPVGTNPASFGSPAQSNTYSGVPNSTMSNQLPLGATPATVANSINMSDIGMMSREKATLAVKNRGVLWGTIFTAVGILGQSLAYYNVFGLESDTNDKIFEASYAPFAIGLVTLIGTYIYLYKNSN
jgi:hypothetical protein